MQKKLFTLSFQPKFQKIRFTKVAASLSFLMMQQIFLFSLSSGARGMFEPNSATSNTHKEWSYHTFVKQWMKALDKTRILTHSYSRHYDGEALRHVFNSSIHLKVVSATGCCLQIEQSTSLGRFRFILIKCNFLQPLGHSHGGRSHSKVALPESQFCDVRL